MGQNTNSVMYVYTDKKKSVQEKLEWMIRAYERRIGVLPKVAFLHPDNVKDETTLEITLMPIKGLNPFNFVLCQEPSDYLAEKATPLPAG